MKRKEQGMQWMQILLIGFVCFLCIFFRVYGGKNHVDARETTYGSRQERSEKPEQQLLQEKKQIAITFDDGPHEIYTPKLLDGLKERHVCASFFVTGENVEKYPDLIRRMKEEGHLIGNHTYHHIQLTNSNGAVFYQELVETNQVIKEITGKDVEYVRPPFGSWNKKYEQELNMFPVLWTIDPMDWCNGNADCVVRHVLKKAEENAIILLHDEYDSSVTAALQIIDQLQKEGYEFVTVDQILVN